jgi:hypothetical protein
MTSSGGGGAKNLVGSVGEAGSVFLDDTDAYSVTFLAGIAKELTEANSVGSATPLNSGSTSGIVVSNGIAGSITLNKVGFYEISLSSSFSSSGGTKVDGAVYLNNVRLGNVAFERDIANPNDVGSVGPSNIVEILSGDLPAVLTCKVICGTSRILSFNHFSLHALGAG